MRLTEESDAKSKTGDFLRWVRWRGGEFAGSGGDLGSAYMQEGCCEKRVQTYYSLEKSAKHSWRHILILSQWKAPGSGTHL